MKSLLYVGDANCDSGFARATHKICDYLHATERWKVHVLGLNHSGDQTPYPYPIYHPTGMTAFPSTRDGSVRIAQLIQDIRPDVVVLQNDTWNIPGYMRQIARIPKEHRPKVVGFLAVDGKNVQGRYLDGTIKGVDQPLDKAIFWTEFAANEARLGGWSGPTAVVPLGVDTSIYYPRNKMKSRREILGTELIGVQQVPIEDAFIVGSIGRNQPRKRLDLQIRFFAEFVRRTKADNAFLFIHTSPTGDVGIDIEQAMAYEGIGEHLILSAPPVGYGLKEPAMAKLINCLDMLMSCAYEGFGLPVIEAMACGIPTALPRWSALEDLFAPAAHMIHCSSTFMTPGGHNMLGGVPDEEQAVAALTRMYQDANYRGDLADRGLQLVQNPRFDWIQIADAFEKELESL
jgi:glycosyltransferase involved in cell wall biosynthesis